MSLTRVLTAPPSTMKLSVTLHSTYLWLIDLDFIFSKLSIWQYRSKHLFDTQCYKWVGIVGLKENFLTKFYPNHVFKKFPRVKVPLLKKSTLTCIWLLQNGDWIGFAWREDKFLFWYLLCSNSCDTPSSLKSLNTTCLVNNVLYI
jgi:hypothetical protein